MDVATDESSTPDRIAAEVIELGEALFDETLAAAAHGGSESGDGEPFPVDAVRAAADEFFSALRLLLRLEEERR